MEQGADVNKAATEDFRATPLHLAVNAGYTDIAVCLMERGMADLNVRNHHGRRPYDLAINEAMRQVIVNEEKRRRDHGFTRCAIPTFRTNDDEQGNDESEMGQGNADYVCDDGNDNDDDDDDDSSDDSDEEDGM